ncbi:MAG: class I SAM-dependent methyltransferase [Terriglobia bacterium]
MAKMAVSKSCAILQPGYTERVVPVDGNGDVTFAEHLARYRFARQFVKDFRVLDAACGTGYGSAMLSEAGAHSVLGIDIDEAAVSFAQQKYTARQGLKFVQAPLSELAKIPSESFELCVSFETIEHLDDPERFLFDVRKTLSRRGKLLISTPNRYRYSPTNYDGRHPQNPYHKIEWTTEEFVSLLCRHFAVTATYGQVFVSRNAAAFRFWADRLRARYPRTTATRPLYALGRLRRRAPLNTFYEAFRNVLLGDSWREGASSPATLADGWITSDERNDVRIYSPNEVPLFSVCLCFKEDQ